MNAKFYIIGFIGLTMIFQAAAQEFPGGEPELNIELVPEAAVTAEPAEDAGDAGPTNRIEQSEAFFLATTGMEYTKEGEFEEAVNAYLRALELEPENLNIRFALSLAYIELGRYPEAVKELERVAADEKTDSFAVHNNLAWCYAVGIGTKNSQKALRHAREAILYVPGSPSAWNTLAEAYYMTGDYDKALRSAEHALDLLLQSKPTQEQVDPFVEQIQKIKSSLKAMEVFTGSD